MNIVLRQLGLTDYAECWQAMRAFTDQRQPGQDSEFWLTQHPPVFTQGQAGKPEHVLDSGDIPVVQSDRGGQVTYHAPGQLVLYVLLDLKQAGLGIRRLVTHLEQSVIQLLAEQGIPAWARQDAPGVYVEQGKIASLGLRVRKGCSYHGLALNIENDLAPFSRINPCGLIGQKMTSTRELGLDLSVEQAGARLAELLALELGSELTHAGQ